MASMNDYESIAFKCGYKPCEHEGKIRFHKYDMDRYSVKQCPACKVWNYTSGKPEIFITQETHDALDAALRKSSNLISKGQLIKDT